MPIWLAIYLVIVGLALIFKFGFFFKIKSFLPSSEWLKTTLKNKWLWIGLGIVIIIGPIVWRNTIPSTSSSPSMSTPSPPSVSFLFRERRPNGMWDTPRPVLKIRMGESFYMNIRTDIGIVSFEGQLINGKYKGVWSDSKRQRGQFKLDASSLRGELYDKFYPKEGWLKIVIKKEHD